MEKLCITTVKEHKADQIFTDFLAGKLTFQRILPAKVHGFFLCVPEAVRRYKDWKRYSRFLCFPNPEKNEIIITESQEVHTARGIVMNSLGAINIPKSTCDEANFGSGASVLIKYYDKKIILRKIGESPTNKIGIKSQDSDSCSHHISANEDFSFAPPYEIRRKYVWTPETLFFCDVQPGKIILAESVDGTVKFHKFWKLYLNRNLCGCAGFMKRDGIRIEYEGKKIILMKDNG